MYIARQPIFDRSMNVYGYELLYRANIESKKFDSLSPVESTATVLGGLFELGINQITDNKKAFINFDYEFLFKDAIELIEPSNLIIEVLETVKVDEKLLERLEYLRKKGYKIALDDYVDNLDTIELYPLASIIKFDLMITPLDEIQVQIHEARRNNKYLLAEKVETLEEFERAKEMGFHLFQGFFFSKPYIVGSIASKKTHKLVYQQLLNELHREEPSFSVMTEIIKSDVNMAYRVLRTSGNQLSADDTASIKAILLRMGTLEIERWVSILILQDFSNNKPTEIVRLSLVRSKFGELIASNTKFSKNKYEISLMCLFSNLDVLLEQPMETAVRDLRLSKEIKDALVHGKGPFSPIINIIRSYEISDFDHLLDIIHKYKISQKDLFDWYIESIRWTNEVFISFLQ